MYIVRYRGWSFSQTSACVFMVPDYKYKIYKISSNSKIEWQMETKKTVMKLLPPETSAVESEEGGHG